MFEEYHKIQEKNKMKKINIKEIYKTIPKFDLEKCRRGKNNIIIDRIINQIIEKLLDALQVAFDQLECGYLQEDPFKNIKPPAPRKKI